MSGASVREIVGQSWSSTAFCNALIIIIIIIIHIRIIPSVAFLKLTASSRLSAALADHPSASDSATG